MSRVRAAHVAEALVFIGLVLTVIWRLAHDRWHRFDEVPPPADAAGLLQEADDAYARADLARAGVLYAQALRADPQSIAARIRLAILFHRNSWPDSAAALLEEVLARESDNTDALLLRARIHRDDGHADLAVYDYQRVLARHPDNPEALYYLGTTYQASKRIEDAIHSYHAAIESDLELRDPIVEPVPYGIQARVQLGRTYKQLGNLQAQDGALSDALTLIDLATDQFRQAGRAARRARLTDYYEATAELTDGLRAKARLLRRAGRPEEEVLPSYEEIVRADPSDPMAWLEAGQVRYRTARTRADLQTAETYLRKAYDLDPANIDALAAVTEVGQALKATTPETEPRR